MAKPIVSILIPVYNVENYLEKCLDSVISQTMNNIEIICVNDGSTDHSGEILEKYQKKDKRIIVVNKENGGLPSARNAGMEIARGKYIGFVDSDDYINSDMYERCIVQQRSMIRTLLYVVLIFIQKNRMRINGFITVYRLKAATMINLNLTYYFKNRICLRFVENNG